MTHPGFHHAEEHAQGFPKMWYFSIFKGFKPELLAPPKSGQIRGKKFLGRRRHKKKTRLQYSVSRPHMNRIGFSHGKFDILFISGLKTAY